VGPNGEIDQTWSLGPKGESREVLLYLPLYKGVVIQEVDLDEGAEIRPPAPFRISGPVVYYGTSITQGGCASNPGMSYPAIVSRRLNLDFVNLGFSGNGWGEEEMAKAMAEIQASAYVLDYWANVSTEDFRKTLPPFVKILRQARPRIPILVMGPFYQTGGFDSEKKKAAEDFVSERRNAGDDRIAFVDGESMITEKTAYGLVDGIHPNTLGFQRMADGMEGPLKKALGLEK
jgi:lysophospholipase L1-like esterase